MRTIFTFCLALFGVFAFQFSASAQEPNFTGTWNLNLEKSKLEDQPNGLTGSIFVIKQKGENFRLTIYHLLGEKRRKFGFKMKADGKTRGVKIIFKGKLVKTETGLCATLSRKNFLNIVNYRFGTSENEFIADEVFTGLPRNHHSVWVFDRDVSKAK